MKRKSGFTIIELMVAIALLGVLLGLGFPSFQSMIQDNRAATVTNQLVTALHTARSEAVKRRANITLCRRNTAGDSCASGTDWSVGWLLYDGTEAVKVWDAPGDSMAIAGPSSGITYTSTGAVGSAGNFSLQPTGCSDSEFRRTISVALSGLPVTSKVDCQ